MSKILYWTVLIAVTVASCGVNKNKENMYTKAYYYIMSLPEFKGEGMILSYQAANIGISSFYSELSNREDVKDVILELDSIDYSRESVTKIITGLEVLHSDTASKNVMFFSEIIDENKILVEILARKDNDDISYYSLTEFNKGKVFLLIYDNSNEISKVYTKEIEYD